MGQLVRAYRHHPHHGHRPLSQGLVAGWLHITQAQLSRIESGPPITDLDRLIAWARTLGVPSRLLWFKLPESPHQFTAPTVEAVEQSEQTDHEEPESPLQPQGFSILPVVINGHPVLVPFDAHTLAASGLGDLPTPLGGAVAGAEVTSPFPQGSVPGPVAASALPGLGLEELERVAAALEDSRRYLDGPVVDYFRAQVEHAKRDDGALGPKKTLPVVLGLLGAIEQHARDVKPGVRRELLTVGADGAEFAGWLYRDIHQPGWAGFWYDRAMEWAQEADHAAMQGYVLLKKSQMAYDDRDALRVFTLAEAAGHDRWQLPVKVKAEVAQQQARAYAMVGEPIDRVERTLGEAHQLLDRFESSPDGSGTQLSSHYSRANLTLQTASCYIEAGQPARAAGTYDEVLQGKSLSPRDQGYFLARRAFSLALAGQPDEAASVGLTSVRFAEATNSLRTKRELRRVVRTLGPWSTRPGPKELGEALRV